MPDNDEIETLTRQNGMELDKTQFMVLLGKYEILQQVGAGGMGKVYRGRDKNLKREVAIKEFAPSQDFKIDEDTLHELETAFQREATLLANLKHDSLPIMFECFTENHKHYLVMEFVEGDDLKRRAKELKEKFDGQFPVEKVRQWAKELLGVLIYLHDRESPVYHRDIKPENLKIRNGKICLLDFGLAKGSAGSISSASTDRTTFGFTARYAPVEQTRGEKTTAQTDLYALAATLYYLLTGVEPVDARTRETALKRGEGEPLRPVKGLRPEADHAFVQIITRGLAVEARERPQSAREMLDILEAGDEPEPLPTPAIPFPNPPNPNPHPLPPMPLPFITQKKSSRLKLIVFSLLGGAILCIVAAIGLALLIPMFNLTPANNNSNQPPIVVSTGKERSLLSERKLYDVPRLGSVIGKLDKGTRVKVDDERKENDGTWYDVKTNSKSGWIFCEKGEKCVSE